MWAGSRCAAAALALGLMLAGLAGCAGTEKPKPTPLEPLTAQIAGKQVWNQRIDAISFPLVVAVNAGVFTVAGGDGTVLAVQADTGREVWRTSIGSKLGAGVGSDGRFAAVVTRDGELVVLDAGKQVWRKDLGTRVTTAPLVAGERVFVLGVDRTVHAFDVLDGRRLWTFKRPGDPLTLAQTGLITAYKDTLVVGQGNRMAGLDPLRGAVRWDVALATPRGTNEVERLADLVGPVARVGDALCTRAFQAAVGCVNAERGNLLWSKNFGGTEAITADDQFLVAADATDRLSGWRASNGETAWSNERLKFRGLSSPLMVGKTVVFGDSEGQVHWLSRDKGEPLLRLPTDGSSVAAAPVVSGTTMLVVTRNGGLYAFRPE
jgi:outer membrane protein assembly factor BamB